MGTNKLVLACVGVIAVMVVVAVINSSNTPTATAQPTTVQAAPQKKVPTPEDGDTVAETIREVQARYEKSLDVNKAQADQLGELTRRLDSLEGRRATGSTAATPDPQVEALKSRLAEMQNDFKVLSANVLKESEEKAAAQSGYRVSGYDLGWAEDGDSSDSKRSANSKQPQQSQSMPGYVIVRPMTRSAPSSMDALLANLPQGKRDSQGLVNTVKESSVGKTLVPEVKKHYTIPARSTLFEATAMTALIGTVPLGGRVLDPFPAKFIIGNENLATNGLQIPGLQGIVFEGVARGNWNLSCVSVSLLSATYTFEDGRIQHMQYDQRQGGGGSRDSKTSSPFAENEASRSIGYISNPQGVPCVAGRRITDAHKQLFTMGVLGAAKSYFDAKAAAETTTNSNQFGGGSTTVTGDAEAFVNNRTYGDSISTVMDFYSTRMRDTFDVIYIDPGADVSLNITQDLLIDYHADARKLAYQTGEGANVHTLD